MAGMLPKSRDSFHRIPDARIAILASMWHAEYVNAMVERARSELSALGVAADNVTVHQIPGSLELPYAARVLFEKYPQLDAIIAFGIVLTGATMHNTSVLQQTVQGFALVSDRYAKPIINEVIGVASLEDAKKRSGDDDLNKGLEAVFALSEILHWRRSLPG